MTTVLKLKKTWSGKQIEWQAELHSLVKMIEIENSIRDVGKVWNDSVAKRVSELTDAVWTKAVTDHVDSKNTIHRNPQFDLKFDCNYFRPFIILFPVHGLSLIAFLLATLSL